MKIYLDTCSLQRPLDSKTQIRIVLEAEAVLSILAQCEAGKLTLVASDALAFETERNPNLARREYAFGALDKAQKWIPLDMTIESQARTLHTQGIQPLDALHLASAEAAEVDYFCTCDDKLLKNARRSKAVHITVVSPLELIQELEK